MGGIGHYNYAQYPLEQKHAWFQSGPGAAAAMQVGDSLKRIAARLDVSDGTIGAGFLERGLGTGWQGSAAHAASGAFDRAAVVLASLSTTSQAGGGTAHQFGDSFTATKNAIPVPPPPTGVNSAVGMDVDSFADTVRAKTGADLTVLGVQSDYRARLVANRNAETAADDALYRHESTTREVLAAYRSAVGSAEQSGASARNSGGADVPAGAAGGEGAARGGVGSAAGPARRGEGAAAGAGRSGGAHPGARRGGSTGPGSAGGPTAAGVGAGAHGGTAAATESAGWTPLPPGQLPGSTAMTPGSSVQPGGLQPGSSVQPGGLQPGSSVQPGNTYLPDSVPPPTWRPSSGSAGGYPGGYRNSTADQPLTPRTGEPAMRGGPGTGGPQSGGAGAAAGAAGRGPGQGGMAPMGMGGAGAGGQGREHRNRFYIPEDEPFRVEFDFYVAPPVIGADAQHEDDR